MLKAIGKFLLYILGYILLVAVFFAIELYAWLLLKPEATLGLQAGLMWAIILASVLFVLPKFLSRILFIPVYFLPALWTIAQVGYYSVFGKLMWFSTVSYADEGAAFLGDVLSSFSASWWIFSIILIVFGILMLIFYPKTPKKFWKLILLVPVILSIVCICTVPEQVYALDEGVWGTHSEYEQVSSSKAAYDTMYDAKKVYDLCGMHHLCWRDLWCNYLYPLTPAFRKEQAQQQEQIDQFFNARAEHQDNEMTGLFESKNVILILMESMDDYMITPQDTPTICQLMDQGIQFTQFYTPGYGGARTLNSEFCMNTGIYLPTTGKYIFNYITNDYSQSIASQLKQQGYSSHVFHYNTDKFYSRSVFEPALGYDSYVSYGAYTDDEDALYNDQLLFELPETEELFFREGQTLNTIITRSAHLSYKYNEVLSHYGLKQYPQYRGLYGSQEEDCARLKAKLVDDLFARILEELEEHGQLKNTVIIAMTDHYTYGYKNVEELMTLSGTEDPLLLERVPCFIWSANCPAVTVDKTLNTADLLPTVINLLGIDSRVEYLGQDAFDPNYPGYAIFPDGSWITNGTVSTSSNLSAEETERMNQFAADFINVSNLLLTSDYYKKP